MSKQAVVLIHGIGNQKPMITLRGFVDAVWTTHTEIHNKYAGHGVWSKPDTASHSFELRRLTTPENAAGIQTDFFEFYWQHLMEGTSNGHVFSWAWSLLKRRPSTVPPQLTAAYWWLRLVALVVLVLLVYAAIAQAMEQPAISPWLSALLGLSLWPIASFIWLNIVGDAARYLHVAPTNIERRHEIRTAGIALLKALHDPSREYSRIILVGHSLGTVIGYDILTHAWVDYHDKHLPAAATLDALNTLETLAVAGAEPAAIQAAQRKYWAELKANGSPWRVTDFVTMGSPLAHAAILLADSGPDLRTKQVNREFPRCLPELERLKRHGAWVERFSFEHPTRHDTYRVPHHAAVFGPTRWTNLYFPCHYIFWGDIVGGPLHPTVGTGVRDVPVSRGGANFLTHTKYWTPKRGSADQHIAALRDALNLLDVVL